MAAVPKPGLTPEEYIAQERRAETKSEYVDGVAYAMTGASREHNLIALNIGAELRQQLRGRPCETYAVDMRVRVSRNACFYPDVVVVCGKPQFEDASVDTFLNPTVIFEVLSPSTGDYDQGGKFARYRSLEALHEYILVAQAECHVMQFVRQPDNSWLLTETRDRDGHLSILSINADLSLAEIYDRVTFQDATPSAAAS